MIIYTYLKQKHFILVVVLLVEVAHHVVAVAAAEAAAAAVVDALLVEVEDLGKKICTAMALK